MFRRRNGNRKVNSRKHFQAARRLRTHLLAESLESRSLLAASLSASLDGRGNLLLNDTLGTATDQVAITSNGTNIVLTATDGILAGSAGVAVSGNSVTVPQASVTGRIVLTLRGGNDVVFVDWSGGDPTTAGGIDYDAGAGAADADRLVIGTADDAAATVTYSTASTALFSGTVAVAGARGPIVFRDIEGDASPLTIGNARALALVLPGRADAATLSYGSSGYVVASTKFAGTRWVPAGGGAASLNVRMNADNGRFTVNSANAPDVITINGEAGNDTVTVANTVLSSVVLIGGAGDDTLTGGGGNDSLNGGDGLDRLTGGPGNDQLLGLAGNDTLFGGTGNDSLSGGAGNDRLGGEAGVDTVLGDAGNDVIAVANAEAATGGRDSMDGGSGTDILELGGTSVTLEAFGRTGSGAVGFESVDGRGLAILGTASANVIDFSGVALQRVASIQGLGGDDVLVGGTGVDTILGGAGNDSIDGGAGNDLLLGEAGADSLVGGAGNDTLDGSSGEDSLADRIEGGLGDDIIRTKASESLNDVLLGGAGSDRLVNLTAGADLFLASFPGTVAAIEQIVGGNAAIRGTEANNVLDFRLSTGGNSFVALAGVTAIYGLGGDDTIHGTDQVNSLYGGAGNDVLQGYAGNDFLDGGDGTDLLVGGEDNDVLEGGTEAAVTDTIQGGSGDDQIRVLGRSAETDVLNGGPGSDTLLNMTSTTTPTDISLSGFLGLTAEIETIAMNGGAIAGTDGPNVFDFRLNSSGTQSVTMSRVKWIVGGAGDDIMRGTATTDTFFGQAGNDKLYGLGGGDYLDGGDGDDSVFGAEGADTLNGGAGNDTLEGDEGNDTLVGGAGADAVRGGDDNDDLYVQAMEALGDVMRGGDGTDRLLNYAAAPLVLNDFRGIGLEIETVVGNSQRITGTSVNDVMDFRVSTSVSMTLVGVLGIEGLGGDDFIVSANSSDSISGGVGNDTIYGQGGNDTIDGGDGDDLLVGGDGADSLVGALGVDTLDGGEGNDTLLGNDGNDTLQGGANNDTLDGGVGADVLIAGDGNDEIRTQHTESVSDTISGGAGTDKLVNIGTTDLVLYNFNARTTSIEELDGNNAKLVGNNDANILDFRLTDAPVLAKLTDVTVIDVGGGNDTVYGSDGIDSIVGGDGDDVLYGFGDIDSLDGGDGNDTLSGGNGADTLLAGPGNDTFLAKLLEGDGDSMVGGTGTDTLSNGGAATDNMVLSGFTASSNGIEALDAKGASIVGNANANTFDFRITTGETPTFITLSNVASIEGLAGNDVIYGTANADTIRGNDGVDQIYGFGGDDVLNGGAGADTIDAGDGDDTIQTQGSEASGDTMQGGSGTDLLQNVDTAATPADLELANFVASANGIDAIDAKNAKIVGTSGANTLDFRTNTTTPTFATMSNIAAIEGMGGDDTIHGGSGADTIRGGDGADIIFAYGGNDVLDGGVGGDTLDGGAGDDNIQTQADESENDSFVGGDGSDDRLTNIGTGSPVPDLVLGEFLGTTNGIEAVYANNVKILGNNSSNTLDFRANVGATAFVQLNGVTTIDGASGNDTIHGTSGVETILGGAGLDSLYGYGGADVLDAGDGNDLILGGADGDSISGGAGDDTIDGGEGNDIIDAGGDDDTVRLSGSNAQGDTLQGGSGSDTLVNIGSEDFILPGFAGQTNGFETVDGNGYWMLGNSDNNVFDFRRNSAGTSFVTLVNVDAVDARAGDDTIYGTDAADTLYGDDGNDVLFGYAGNDVLDGGAGGDSLEGGAGDDDIDGGSGADTIRTLPVDSLNDTLQGGAGSDRLENIGNPTLAEDFQLASFLGTANGIEIVDANGAKIVGTSGSNTLDFRVNESATGFVTLVDVVSIDAGGGNDTIYGTAAADSIFGGAGDDLIYGYGGDDYLDGGAGADEIYGGDGLDSILGGLGLDLLAGGSGTDVFRFDSSSTDRGELDIVDDYADDTLQVLGYGSDYDAITFDGTAGVWELTLAASGKNIRLTGVTTKPASNRFRFS